MEQAKMMVLFVIYTILFIGIIVGLIFFANYRTNELNDWADKYEECVEENYRTTPIEYYQEHGKYPDCVVKN